MAKKKINSQGEKKFKKKGEYIKLDEKINEAKT